MRGDPTMRGSILPLAILAFGVVPLANGCGDPFRSVAELDESPQVLALDVFQVCPNATPVPAALDWATTGWPEWGQYQPLAQAALERGLPLIPANLPRATVKAMGKEGISALPPGEAARLGLDRPLSPEHEAALAEEIRQAHCGHLPETVVPRMIDVQRAKDAAMALALTEESPEGGVLITGSVHARADRGVPFHLAGRKVTTAAFLEVNARWSKPDDYAAGFGAAELPFDVVWFTPRVDEADPCEKYAEQLKALRDKGIGNGMKTP